jgi:tetratricopeptide (TPR) repeat protein
VLNNLGFALYTKGQHDEAIKVLGDAILRSPNQWQSRYHRGLAFQAKGEHQLAATDFEAVIALTKGAMPDAYLAAAEAHFQLGNSSVACAYLDQVIQVPSGQLLRPDIQMAANALATKALALQDERCHP